MIVNGKSENFNDQAVWLKFERKRTRAFKKALIKEETLNGIEKIARAFNKRELRSEVGLNGENKGQIILKRTSNGKRDGTKAQALFRQS